MELKVAGTLFNSGGGGGGGFYFGRGQQDQPREEEAAEAEAPELAPDERHLSRLEVDRSRLTCGVPSRLQLGLPAAPTLEAPMADVGLDDAAITALQTELEGKVRVLQFALTRIEASYARRLRAEVGELRVG
jgi:hypothetical protein